MDSNRFLEENNDQAKNLYRSATEVKKEDGKSMAAIIGTNYGTVIPKSSIGGCPLGFDPHVARSVNVDPHIPDKMFSVDLSKVDRDITTKRSNKDRISKAAQRGENLSDVFIAGFMDLKQELQSTVIKEIIPPQPKEPELAPANATIGKPLSSAFPQMPKPMFPKSIARSVVDDKVAKINSTVITKPAPKRRKKFANNNQDDSNPPKDIGPIVGPPSCAVIFESEVFGELETAYHDVIRGDDGVSLILVYDKRYKGGGRYSPPITEEVIYVDVRDHSEVYEVHNPGQHFVHGDYDYRILLIDQVARK